MTTQYVVRTILYMTQHTIPTWQLRHRMSLALEVSGVSPEQMAAELGKHVNSVHNYTSGRRNPKRADVRIWAQVCQVSEQWLETGETEDTGGVTRRDQLSLWDDLHELAAA